MFSQSWTTLLLCLISVVQFGSSQVPTPVPFTITETFTATVDLWSASNSELSTATVSPSGTAAYRDYSGLNTTAVNYSLAYVINLSDSPGSPICTFATSGTWSLLPRLIFYLTLLFALVARTHEWLVGGALAATLLYSSLAALQVMFQVWTEQATAELDFIALTGILACSCIMAVPLMNWSSTIQNLGSSKKDENTADENIDYGSSGTVLVFWSVLVGIGFISAFVGLQAYFRGADWIDIGLPLDGKVGPQNITCVPLNGYLNTSAGQQPDWSLFWITREFVEQNNCRNPCEDVTQVNTLFRSADELKMLGMSAVNRWYEQDNLSKRDTRNIRFVLEYFRFLLFALPFVLLQGLMYIVLFWRTSPQEARWKIYRWVAIPKPKQGQKPKTNTRHIVAKTLALAFYFFALLVVIIAPVAFIVTVVATEIASQWITESETRNHVDQWGVFAAAILTLIAALICRYEPGIRRLYEQRKLHSRINNINNELEKRSGKAIHPKISGDSAPKHSSVVQELKEDAGFIWDDWKYHAKDFYSLIAFEWFQFRKFWDDAKAKPLPRNDPSNKRWSPDKPTPIREVIRKKQEASIKALKRELEQSELELQKYDNVEEQDTSKTTGYSVTTRSIHASSNASNPTSTSPTAGLVQQPPNLTNHSNPNETNRSALTQEQRRSSGNTARNSRARSDVTSISNADKLLPRLPANAQTSTDASNAASSTVHSSHSPSASSTQRIPYHRINSSDNTTQQTRPISSRQNEAFSTLEPLMPNNGPGAGMTDESRQEVHPTDPTTTHTLRPIPQQSPPISRYNRSSHQYNSSGDSASMV